MPAGQMWLKCKVRLDHVIGEYSVLVQDVTNGLHTLTVSEDKFLVGHMDDLPEGWGDVSDCLMQVVKVDGPAYCVRLPGHTSRGIEVLQVHPRTLRVYDKDELVQPYDPQTILKPRPKSEYPVRLKCWVRYDPSTQLVLVRVYPDPTCRGVYSKEYVQHDTLIYSLPRDEDSAFLWVRVLNHSVDTSKVDVELPFPTRPTLRVYGDMLYDWTPPDYGRCEVCGDKKNSCWPWCSSACFDKLFPRKRHEHQADKPCEVCDEPKTTLWPWCSYECFRKAYPQDKELEKAVDTYEPEAPKEPLRLTFDTVETYELFDPLGNSLGPPLRVVEEWEGFVKLRSSMYGDVIGQVDLPNKQIIVHRANPLFLDRVNRPEPNTHDLEKEKDAP